MSRTIVDRTTFPIMDIRGDMYVMCMNNLFAFFA